MIKLFSKFRILLSLCVLLCFVFLISNFNENDKIRHVEAALTSCKGPADVMLVIDRSGTMGNNFKFSNAKSESISFVDKLFSAVPESGPEGFNYHQIGLVAFNQNVATVNLSQDRDEIKNDISDSNGIFGDSYPIGSRKTDTAIQQARLKLSGENGGNAFATKTMIILTDGAPNNLNASKNQVDFAKEDDIRIISIGLELDTIEDAKEFLVYAASSPADCYYVYSSGEELENCTSISFSELGTVLDGVYTDITAAVCDDTPPTISISRKPSGTLYANDKLTITSNAIDDIGFKSHEIMWSDDWPDNLQTVQCTDFSGTTISCCDTGKLGPFSTDKTITYRSIAVDTNNNEINIDTPEAVTVANVSLAVPLLFRNIDNNIEVTISNYGGGDNFFISINAPALAGIDKDPITNCSDSGNIRTCNYNFNPNCNWTDGIINGVANNIDVNIYIYADSGDMDIRQIASAENNPLVSYFEGKDWTGTCTDGKNNDCNYDTFDNPIVDLEEMLCDTENPLIGISRVPGSDVYDDDLIFLTSSATDDNGIKQHTAYYIEDSVVLQTAFDCNDANADSWCDEDVSQNIANISDTIGSFVAGTQINYYSKAIDYSGNDNVAWTEPVLFTVKSRECEGVADLGDCSVTPSAKCCGGICNVAISNPYSYDTNHCVEEICSGTSWEWGPANDAAVCSASGNVTECHSFSSLYGPPPYFHDGGCEERDYVCSSGYCVFSADIKEDYCVGGGSLILNDYECSGNSCVLDPDPAVENDICDFEFNLDNLSINAYNSASSLISGNSGVIDGEVLNNLTNKVSLRLSTSDVNGISEQKIYWKKSTETIFTEISCDISLCEFNSNACTCTVEIGPFDIGDIVEFYALVKDNSPNQNGIITLTYHFTVYNHQCYDVPGGAKPNLTPCDSGNGKCCGGTCDSTISATFYDEGCYVDSCSETDWVSVAGNEGVGCGSAGTCFPYYTGCVNGYKCDSGYCGPDTDEALVDSCSENIFTDFGCSETPENCEVVDANVDCSFNGNSDGDTVACNCDCNNYDIEEKIYSSLSFDGVDDYVSIPNSTIFNTTNLTISAWVNFADDSLSFIFEKGNVNTQYSLFSHGTDIVFRTKPVDGSYDTLSIAKASVGINNNQWHHIVGTYDGAVKKLYVDGDEKLSRDWVKTIETNNNGSSIGRFGGTTTGYYFNGSIDDVRIYNRALYPKEVVDQYNGIFADNTGLVGYWNLDEGTGETVYDNSGNGNNGTLKNGPEWMKHYHGSASGPSGNVSENWQACTDGKDNDCDGIYDEYIGVASDCDGDVLAVSAVASAKNRSGVLSGNLFEESSNITIYDSDIREVANEFMIKAVATDDFSITQLIIEWTTDNWTTTENEICNNTGSCEVCVEGGSCEVGRDNILSSSLSAGKTFKFKVCATDGSANNNQKCTTEYSITIENSNGIPVITPLAVVDPDFCSEKLKYILKWEFDDDGDMQDNFEIQIKENDFGSPGSLIINKIFNLSDLFYQINYDDFEAGESIEYGKKEYYWRVKVTDDRGGGYEQTTDWEIGPAFTTPLYEYPKVDFIVTPDYSDPCLYETYYVGPVDTCDWGENIKFSTTSSSTFVECTSSGNEQCLTTVSSKCDTANKVCISCTNDSECANFNIGEIVYSCSSGVCETSDSCAADNNDCLAADTAKCNTDTLSCVACDDDSQCEKFNAGNISSGLLGDVSLSSSNTLTDSSKSWLVNEWAGGAIKIVSGTGSDQTRAIISNTDKEITIDFSWTVLPDNSSEYRIIKYFCNNEGLCENKEHRKWWFYDSVTYPDSRDSNPINNYIESEVNNYDVTLEITDIINNSCRKVKNIRLGGREYPKWNEVAPYN
ncbi:MAG: LamG-like jellyroll fold domain-containing protein [Patescibacteria group bacterium]|nr:LamG-like jellyroll fold domain-containing protein [Patescibacteria group bacterium]